jgi:hypothetical protein
MAGHNAANGHRVGFSCRLEEIEHALAVGV